MSTPPPALAARVPARPAAANAAAAGQGDAGMAGKYRGAQGLDPEFIKKLEKQFGFDKPALCPLLA